MAPLPHLSYFNWNARKEEQCHFNWLEDALFCWMQNSWASFLHSFWQQQKPWCVSTHDSNICAQDCTGIFMSPKYQTMSVKYQWVSWIVCSSVFTKPARWCEMRQDTNKEADKSRAYLGDGGQSVSPHDTKMTWDPVCCNARPAAVPATTQFAKAGIPKSATTILLRNGSLKTFSHFRNYGRESQYWTVWQR